MSFTARMVSTPSTSVLFWLLLLSGLTRVLGQSCWKETPCTGPNEAAFPGIWETNIYAPESRTVQPATVLEELRVNVSSEFASSGTVTFHGNGSRVVYDFGKEVGGIVSLDYRSTGSGALGIAFTEAKDFIGEWSDSSNGGFKGPDGALYANFTGAGKGTYVMPEKRLRGGFRYMTLFLVTAELASVEVENIALELSFQPTWSNLRAYQGYFHSSDELLNRIWYSGAYTLQTNAVPPNTGRQVPFVSHGWANNGTLGPGENIIVDGAKRDRAVWPGDMGIAVPSAFVSLGDLEDVKNALQVMYNTQNKETGAFDESGPPLSQKGSDTYHMWTMIGTYNYVLFTNDTGFLQQNWDGYLKAMDYIYGKVTYASGLLDVTGTRDWARYYQGHNNTEAQMILYHTLKTGESLATWLADSTGLADTWSERAVRLRAAIIEYCWDRLYGAFKDNATATELHPQDANSMALLFGVVSGTQADSVSEKLTRNWTPIGAVAPELPGNISPFISGFEIQGHFRTGHSQRALELIRRSWGWYINNPNGTQSTVVEGYLQNGTWGYRWDRGYMDDPSYTSHSHGWSSGPTSALVNYVVGLAVTSPAGATWSLSPQFGDLAFAEGGFTTSLGRFQASWQRRRSSRGSTSGLGYVLLLSFSAPHGTTGTVSIPCRDSRGRPRIELDGQALEQDVVRSADGTVTLAISGGPHRLVLS